jgi:hypothetical protein
MGGRGGRNRINYSKNWKAIVTPEKIMVLGIARSKIYGTPILHFFWGYNSLPVFRIVYPVSSPSSSHMN